MQKQCSECNQTKPSSCFYKNRTNKDGLFGKCKGCSEGTKKERALNEVTVDTKVCLRLCNTSILSRAPLDAAFFCQLTSLASGLIPDICIDTSTTTSGSYIQFVCQKPLVNGLTGNLFRAKLWKQATRIGNHPQLFYDPLIPSLKIQSIRYSLRYSLIAGAGHISPADGLAHSWCVLYQADAGTQGVAQVVTLIKTKSAVTFAPHSALLLLIPTHTRQLRHHAFTLKKLLKWLNDSASTLHDVRHASRAFVTYTINVVLKC